MNDNKNNTPHPDDPVKPEDYNPDHSREYPHELEEVTGVTDNHRDPSDYENRGTDESSRKKPGKMVVPPSDDNAGEGWTLPDRAGEGWQQPLEHTLEEQIDEPETPCDVKNK